MKKLNWAIVGVTGMVGGMFIKVLEERKIPVGRLLPLASARSAGQHIRFNGQDLEIEALTEDSFEGIDIALFAVEGPVSQKFAPIAVKAGAKVVDNSSYWRMDENVPLVVPEVNPQALTTASSIFANPNCCATPATVALKPLADKYGLQRVIISTYQSVSGAGVGGMEDLTRTLQGEKPQHFPHTIAGNLIPHIDTFEPDGYTGEEKKLMAEIRKILAIPALPITATTVRVPVEYGHSLSINVTLAAPFAIEDIRKLFATAPGVVLQDDGASNLYPMPRVAAGTDHVYIGRLRKDDSFPNTLNMWVVADNIRKGAATNAVQIAQEVLTNW